MCFVLMHARLFIRIVPEPPSIYMCVREQLASRQTRLRVCVGLSEHLLLAYVISTNIS